MRDPYGIVGRTIDRRYLVSRFVAEGGFGVVYEAEAVALGVKVAIKVLRSEIVASSPEARARFDQEARVLARLRHPGIVSITDASHLDDGTPYLALEWIDGETLDRYLERMGALPLDDALRLLGPVANAIAHAHAQQVIHRDLKPSNVMIGRTAERDEAKVLDFGLARWSNANGVRTTSESGTGLSIGFAAPEQYGKEFGPVDERADQFALAAVVWASLTAKAPFAGETLTEVMWATCMNPRRPRLAAERPDLPAAVDDVLQRALSIRPEARFNSIKELWTALEEAARHGDDGGVRTARAAPPTEAKGSIPDVATLPSPDLNAMAPRTQVSGSLGIAPTQPAPITGPAGTSPTGAGPSPRSSRPPPRSEPVSAVPSTRASTATRWGILVALGAAVGAAVFAVWPLVAPVGPRPLPSHKPIATSKPAPSVSAHPALGPCGVLAESEACIEGTHFIRGPADCATIDPLHRAACPPTSVEVARFVLDRFEVSVAQWSECVHAGKCPAIGAPDPKLPMRNVTQANAAEYCAYKKKRLPTDDEWELAAAGKSHRSFPWGNSRPSPALAIYTSAEPTPGPAAVDAPSGETPEHVLHLAGNVAEWTKSSAPSTAPWPDGVPPSEGPRAWVRGGGYDASEDRLQTFAREAYPTDTISPSIGFRCARAPK